MAYRMNYLSFTGQANAPSARPSRPAFRARKGLPARRRSLLPPGPERLRLLAHFAGRAVAAGDNGALRRLVRTAKSDPFVAPLVPPDLEIQSTGRGSCRVVSTLGGSQLFSLAQRTEMPLRALIASAPPGRYQYHVEGGRVVAFAPLGGPDVIARSAGARPARPERGRP